MILETQGHFVDTVRSCMQISGDDRMAPELWKFVIVLEHSDGTHPTGIPRIEAFFRTLAQFDSKNIQQDELGLDIPGMFIRKATKFFVWLGWVAKEKAYRHPKYINFLSRTGSEFGEQQELETMEELLTMPHVRDRVLSFLAAVGAVDHLYTPCWRSGGLQGLLTLSQQDLLVAFWGSEAASAEELSWQGPDGQDSLHYPSLGQKSLFITETGYVGYGPFGISDGDQIIILPGCQYPFLVRKKGEFYQVVGICRMYGIVDGEMSAKFNAGEMELKDITLI